MRWNVIVEALTIIEDKGIEEDEPSNAIGNRFSNFAMIVPANYDLREQYLKSLLNNVIDDRVH